jgi:hypothetical protein
MTPHLDKRKQFDENRRGEYIHGDKNPSLVQKLIFNLYVEPKGLCFCQHVVGGILFIDPFQAMSCMS